MTRIRGAVNALQLVSPICVTRFGVSLVVVIDPSQVIHRTAPDLVEHSRRMRGRLFLATRCLTGQADPEDLIGCAAVCLVVARQIMRWTYTENCLHPPSVQ